MPEGFDGNIRFSRDRQTGEMYVNLDDLQRLIYGYADSGNATPEVRSALYGLATSLTLLCGYGEARPNPYPVPGQPDLNDWRKIYKTIQDIRNLPER